MFAAALLTSAHCRWRFHRQMAPNLFNRDALQDSMESISRETEIGAPLNVSASKTTFRKTEPKADCDGLGQSSARQLRRSRHAGVWAEQRVASVFQRDAGRLGRLRGARPYFGNAFSENGIQGRLRWFMAEQCAAVGGRAARGG